MYEIYCIYDITYLHKILNSIVLFFNSPVSKAVYSICSLLYVISLSIKGISKGEVTLKITNTNIFNNEEYNCGETGFLAVIK